MPASEVTASRLPVFTRNRPLSGPVTIRFLAVPTRPGMDSPSAAAVAMPAVRLRSCTSISVVTLTFDPGVRPEQSAICRPDVSMPCSASVSATACVSVLMLLPA